MRRYRIKKGVRPYGGRAFPGYEETLPNGRKVIVLYVDTSAAHKNTGLGGDPREYKPSEVDEIKERSEA